MWFRTALTLMGKSIAVGVAIQAGMEIASVVGNEVRHERNVKHRQDLRNQNMRWKTQRQAEEDKDGVDFNRRRRPEEEIGRIADEYGVIGTGAWLEANPTTMEIEGKWHREVDPNRDSQETLDNAVSLDHWSYTPWTADDNSRVRDHRIVEMRWENHDKT